MSWPTTRTFVYPSECTASRTRCADVFMSNPLDGIEEFPMPGRSGAITVKRGASAIASGFHMRESSAYPCNRTTAGPCPPTVALTTAPSTFTEWVLKPGPKSTGNARTGKLDDRTQKKASTERLRDRTRAQFITHTSL